MKLKASLNLILCFVFCLFAQVAIAQTADSSPLSESNLAAERPQLRPEKSAMPTTSVLYQNKRINLVIFVLATIFVGIILYLIRIERKINKLEKNNS